MATNHPYKEVHMAGSVKLSSSGDFKELKHHLSMASFLQLQDPKLPFVVKVNASDVGVRAFTNRLEVGADLLYSQWIDATDVLYISILQKRV